MPWLKLLHLGAVIVWCGTLLYLPAAIASAGSGERRTRRQALLRLLFTSLATPAALVAVVSGTAVFALHGPLADWLVVKLAFVGLLVLAHLGCGLLILRVERGSARRGADRGKLAAVGGTSLLAVAGTAGVVLLKPF